MNSEVWLRAQYQTVIKERDLLQAQLKAMERENDQLRRSVYDLSFQLAQLTPSSLSQVKDNITRGRQLRLYHAKEDDGMERASQLEDASGKILIKQEDDHQSEATPSNRLLTFPLRFTQGKGDQRAVEYESELKGHQGAVYCSDISSDDRYLATGGFDKTIHVWEVACPYKIRCVLMGHTQLVSDLCWGALDQKSEDADRTDDENSTCKYLLYSVSFDKTIRVWDVENKVCLSIVKLKGLGTSVSLCMPTANFPMGFVTATTSTQFVYFVDNLAILKDNSCDNSDSASRRGDDVSHNATLNNQPYPGAIFHKHLSVATAAVSYADPFHGCGVLLGDVAGFVSFYKIGDNDHSSSSSRVPGSQLSPSIISQQCLHGSSHVAADKHDGFRMLDLKVCGKGSLQNSDARHRDTLLAVQCTDNRIRLYVIAPILSIDDKQAPELIRNVSESSCGSFQSLGLSSPDNVAFREFLRPLRVLDSHVTGEWVIRMQFICGSQYCVHSPHVRPRGKKSSGEDHRQPSDGIHVNKSIESLSSSNVKSYRSIIPVDSNADSASVGRNSDAGSVGGRCDNLSQSDAHNVDTPRSRCHSRGSSIMSDDRNDPSKDNTNRVRSGSDGTISQEHSLDDNDDDNDFSMIAGLVGSQLMPSEDPAKDLLADDCDILDLAAGVSSRFAPDGEKSLCGGRRLANQAINWENSLMLFTGSADGKVVAFDVSAISRSGDAGLLLSSEGNKLKKHDAHSMVWKILQAQSSGKCYGVSVNKDNSLVFSHGSESCISVWRLSDKAK